MGHFPVPMSAGGTELCPVRVSGPRVRRLDRETLSSFDFGQDPGNIFRVRALAPRDHQGWDILWFQSRREVPICVPSEFQVRGSSGWTVRPCRSWSLAPSKTLEVLLGLGLWRQGTIRVGTFYGSRVGGRYQSGSGPSFRSGGPAVGP